MYNECIYDVSEYERSILVSHGVPNARVWSRLLWHARLTYCGDDEPVWPYYTLILLETNSKRKQPKETRGDIQRRWSATGAGLVVAMEDLHPMLQTRSEQTPLSVSENSIGLGMVQFWHTHALVEMLTCDSRNEDGSGAVWIISPRLWRQMEWQIWFAWTSVEIGKTIVTHKRSSEDQESLL